MDEHDDETQHGYLLSNLDFVGFLLPLAVSASVAYGRLFVYRQIYKQNVDFVFLPIHAYPIYGIIGIAALVVFFKSKSRLIKCAAVSTLVGNFLMAGGYSFLLWAFRGMGESD